jgi:hypothetical protein
MLRRIRREPREKPFLTSSFVIADQKEAMAAQMLFGLQPTLLEARIAHEVVRRIQGDRDLMREFVSLGTESGEFLLGEPKMTSAGLEFPFQFYVARPRPRAGGKRR